MDNPSVPCVCSGTQLLFRCLAIPRGWDQQTFSVKGDHKYFWLAGHNVSVTRTQLRGCGPKANLGSVHVMDVARTGPFWAGSGVEVTGPPLGHCHCLMGLCLVQIPASLKGQENMQEAHRDVLEPGTESGPCGLAHILLAKA